jgi:hypothetical protein
VLPPNFQQPLSPPVEVSVVIPTYNRWPLLGRALHAAFLQADVDLEVVVVVDGGTDDTVEQLAAVEDPRLRVVALEVNQGVAAARNLGAQHARGEWLSFLDDDDVWAPRRTRAMVDAGRAAGAGLVMTGTVTVDERGRVMDVQPPPPGREIRQRLFQTNVVGGPSAALLQRQAFLAVGGFDAGFNVLADWDLWLRVLDAHSAAAAPGILSGYAIHADGMHVQHTAAAVDEFRRLVARHEGAGRADGLHFDQAHFMRWIADTHRRAGRRGPAARQLAANLVRFRSVEDVRRIAAAVLSEHVKDRLWPGRARSDRTAPRWLAQYAFGPPAPPAPLALMPGGARTGRA